MSAGPFSRRRDGVHVTLAEHERSLVSQLAEQVVALIETGDASDPALSRLLPDAYAGDAEASAEFRRLTADDLTLAKVENARLVRESLDAAPAAPLSPAAVQAWLRTLTDLRLTLGTRLGVTADGTPAPSDREAELMGDVFDWLGYLQETLVRLIDR